jgi:cytochrome c oxidase subunit 4
VANPTEKADEHAAQSHGTGRYFGVWAVLLGCTALTVITGHRDLGSFNLPLALVIATLKASLVVIFFMHMNEMPTANRIVFGVSIVFAILLIVGVFGDLWTRNAMTLPSAAPSTFGPEFEAPAGAERSDMPGHEP